MKSISFRKLIDRESSGGLRYLLILIGLTLLILTRFDANAQSLVIESPTPQSFGFFGAVVAGFDDVNGDTVDDIVISSLEYFAAGRVYIFSGLDGTLLRTITSPNTQNFGGFGLLAPFQDIDSDGIRELVVTAPGEPSSLNVTRAGRGYVFSGLSGSAPIRTFDSPNPQVNGFFGTGTQPVIVPDRNMDGFEDYVIGRSATSSSIGGEGKAYLFSGMDGTLLQTYLNPLATPVAPWSFSNSITRIEDLDADMIGDLLISAFYESVSGQTQAGLVHIISGGTGALIDTIVAPTPTAFSNFGAAVAIDDLTGDSVQDILVGELYGGSDDNGRIYLFSGADRSLIETIASPTPNTPQDTIRSEFAGAIPLPDLTGDGMADFAVAARGENDGAGRLHFFSGSDRSLFLTLDSPNPEGFGTVIADGGGNFGGLTVISDFSGDGKPDLAIAAAGESAPALHSGRVYIYRTDEPNARVSPTELDFGSVELGDPPPPTQTIRLDNKGFVPLNFTGPAFAIDDPTHFSIVGTPNSSALATNAYVEIEVAYSPTGSGSHAANLTITSDDPDTPTLLVSLVGVATDGPLSVSDWRNYE